MTVLKSYAKINLTLTVNKRLSTGLHNIQTTYCLINLADKISIKKIRNRSSDKLYFTGPFAKDHYISFLNQARLYIWLYLSIMIFV